MLRKSSLKLSKILDYKDVNASIGICDAKHCYKQQQGINIFFVNITDKFTMKTQLCDVHAKEFKNTVMLIRRAEKGYRNQYSTTKGMVK